MAGARIGRTKPARSAPARAAASAVALGAVLLVAVASAGGALADDPNIDPMEPITHRGDQYLPKPPGTKEDLR